jgi:uncharacterized protein
MTVVNQRHPLRINIGFLLHQAIGTSRDIHFDLPSYNLSPDFEVHNLTGLVRISRTPQGLFFQGEFDAATQMECVRCLTEFEQGLHAHFDELFAFKHESITESGLVVPDDGNIDLAPLVREYLMIELPIKPLCQPDCKGLCIVCGENLNTSTCEHRASIKIE